MTLRKIQATIRREKTMLQWLMAARDTLAICCLASLAFASQASSASIDGNIAAGKAFARKHCAPCHAIGREGESPNKAALPLRMLSKRYPLDSLYEAFAEGSIVGHTNMPEFQLDPAVITDLLAYIQSISQN